MPLGSNFQISFICVLLLCLQLSYGQEAYHESWRPQIHFSPKAKWMNDPNGMVYYKGVYHLFFQYFPGATVWGPMHWGHATSWDLMHWHQEPIALYPDTLGYIFSGSAVVDSANSSHFGQNGKEPLIAVFTQSDPIGEKAKRTDYQNQSIAYSLDSGATWNKYAGNPVLKNPGIIDFRDPKVFWYDPKKKWVMTLATKDRISFFSSTDLKSWKKESEFGQGLGAHGGVWECPDLFTLDDHGKPIWVLIVNLNPGGPNNGSATQYFLGDFDGNKFVPMSMKTKWLDYGPDEYAGVTWSNTSGRKIFLGWMSNWLYASLVPTLSWRNAMTIPRQLQIRHVGGETFVASLPVLEFNTLQYKGVDIENQYVNQDFNFSDMVKKPSVPCLIKLSADEIKECAIVLSNDSGERLVIGYHSSPQEYYIDRTASGEVGFQKDFAAKHSAPRLTDNKSMELSLILDESSVELFADNGLSVMTEIFFPDKPYDHFQIHVDGALLFKKIEFIPLKSIWP